MTEYKLCRSEDAGPRRVFQVHATKNGELVAMAQRELPASSEISKFAELVLEMRADVVRVAFEKGGCDEITLHMQESDGFLWMATNAE